MSIDNDKIQEQSTLKEKAKEFKEKNDLKGKTAPPPPKPI